MSFKLQQQVQAYWKPLEEWLTSLEMELQLPLYTSVDIRDAGFKAAIVDTNLFPSGFNNLCHKSLEEAVSIWKQSLQKLVPHCSRVLLIAEEHTRNTWYLENVRIMQELTEQGGLHCDIATFLPTVPNDVQGEVDFWQLVTATGAPLRIYDLNQILKRMQQGDRHYDLVVMNNDLMQGVPETLQAMDLPIYPPLHAGWHVRQKSKHFTCLSTLLETAAQILNCDPWFLSCLDCALGPLDVRQENSGQILADAAEQLLDKITEKYREHGISEKPFLFLKADSGTYGMGVQAFETAHDLHNLNRKQRNSLSRGKGASEISRYLLQEGVPTTQEIDQLTSEVCVYQVQQNFIGAFYRQNTRKTSRQNLNSQGMQFRKMCLESFDPHSVCQTSFTQRTETSPGCADSPSAQSLQLYQFLARLAVCAASYELRDLEQNAFLEQESPVCSEENPAS